MVIGILRGKGGDARIDAIRAIQAVKSRNYSPSVPVNGCARHETLVGTGRRAQMPSARNSVTARARSQNGSNS